MTDIEKKLNPWEINYENTIAVQGESQGRTINITIIDRRGQTDNSFNAESIDRPVDLTSASVRLYCHKPDGTVTFSDGTVTDATNGIASFILPYQATTAAGDVACEVLVTWPNNSTLKAVGLHLDVQESNLEGAVESSSEFSAVVTALNRISQSVTAAQTAVTNADTATANANTARDNANTAATNANTKATLADQKATLADQKATLANTAAGTADTATTNANTARDSANAAATTANTAADRANDAADAVDEALSGNLDPAIDARLAAQKDVAGGIAGYDATQTALGAKVDSSDVVTSAAANKILKLNSSGDFPASITGNAATATKVNATLIVNQGYGGQTGTYDGSVAVTFSAPKITFHTTDPTGTLEDGELWVVY